jgi:hypothetical protein
MREPVTINGCDPCLRLNLIHKRGQEVALTRHVI